MTRFLKMAWSWLWRQIVQPYPFPTEPPQNGPFELYTVLPVLHGGDVNGYKLEQKIAGMQSYKECERIANQMGLIDFYVLRRKEIPANAQCEMNGHRGRRVRVA